MLCVIKNCADHCSDVIHVANGPIPIIIDVGCVGERLYNEYLSVSVISSNSNSNQIENTILPHRVDRFWKICEPESINS